MTPADPARIWGFIADRVDVAVLLRLGPSPDALIVLWDLANDAFEAGQWLPEWVYEGECDLSPDGKLFVYQAIDMGQKIYSAVSRPPYFTPLAVWPQASTYERGFRWWSTPRPLLRPKLPTPAVGSIPKRFVEFLRPAAETKSGLDHGWGLSGWGHPMVLKRLCFEGELSWGRDIFPQSRHWYLLNGEPLDAEWADVDHRGRLLLARAGKIYRRDRGIEHELIDLNSLESRSLEAPGWAMEWP